MYLWRRLEPSRGQYNFSTIREDVDYLQSHGKKLFIQLQDMTFYTPYLPLPDYLMSDEFDGGVLAMTSGDENVGWVAKRWNPAVRERFSALLHALGEEFDGEIEGINLQESALDIDPTDDPSFTPAAYASALQDSMHALKSAFPTSITMQYANFMPGEWLPFEDNGYLRGLYETGEEIGVGLGTPDLLFKRKGQLNNPIAMMHEGEFSVPLGIAIQDGNYVGATGADDQFSNRETTPLETSSIVSVLHAFADDFLNVDYMSWVNQQPYFEEQVLECLEPDLRR